MTVLFVLGVGAVVVLAVTLAHEQALEYRTKPEQAKAYEGIVESETVFRCLRSSVVIYHHRM